MASTSIFTKYIKACQYLGSILTCFARDILLGLIVKLNSLCSFHVSCLLIHLGHVFESGFASGIKDVTFVLIYM